MHRRSSRASVCKKLGGVGAMQFGVEKGDILRTFSPDISSNIRKIFGGIYRFHEMNRSGPSHQNGHGHLGEGKHNR
jgi:hypothetical protein